MAWLEGDMSGIGGNGARTGGALGDNLGGATEGDGALLNAEDIRAQGGLLVLDHNRNWGIKATCSRRPRRAGPPRWRS